MYKPHFFCWSFDQKLRGRLIHETTAFIGCGRAENLQWTKSGLKVGGATYTRVQLRYTWVFKVFPKLDCQHVVLLLINYIASQLLGIAHSITCCVRKKIASIFHKINPLWTKLAQSRWLNILWLMALCWLARFYCLLYFLGLDWLKQTVLWSIKLSYIF